MDDLFIMLSPWSKIPRVILKYINHPHDETKKFGAAVVASIFMASAAHAATVRVIVAGSAWDVTAIYANYHDFKQLWASQPW
jgi:hypothetical protein